MIARIYAPSKTAMQSGMAGTRYWILRYELVEKELEQLGSNEPIVTDMSKQISMRFSTKDQAVAFALRHAILHRVENCHKAKRCCVSYADNFRVDRKQPWTH